MLHFNSSLYLAIVRHLCLSGSTILFIEGYDNYCDTGGHETVTEETLRDLFARFRDFVTSKNIPEIKKFIASYVDKVIIYNEHVEVLFKLDAAGVAIDGTFAEEFAATADKRELFRLNVDAV